VTWIIPLAPLVQAAARTSTVEPRPSNTFAVTLDIAGVLAALLWPLLVLSILLIYRQRIPSLFGFLAKNLRKFEFAGISLELAKATGFTPNWSAAGSGVDLRRTASAVQINDSTLMNFRVQLGEGGTADYAEINLGAGAEWLTSRLFIMSIVFAQVKDIRCFVFEEATPSVRRRYVGWAEPYRLRWALAQRYPWLEQAYAKAYDDVLARKQAFVVDHGGRLGNQLSTRDPTPSIELVREFLMGIQSPAIPVVPVPEVRHWVKLDTSPDTYEHGSWITTEELEETLGGDLIRASVRSAEIRAKSAAERPRIFLGHPTHWVGVVADDQRFEYLVDRNVLLEQVADAIATAPTE
jgi:hypothetical protein